MAFIVIPAAPRSTSLLTFPAAGLTIPAGAQFGQIVFDMPIDAERANSSQHMDFGIQVSTNGGTTYKPYLMAGWNGGTGSIAKNSTVVNPAPTAQVAGDFFQAFAGAKAQVFIKLKEPMTVGGTITSSRFV